MSYFVKASFIAVSALALLATEAHAQYYTPVAPQSYGQQPVGLGLDFGVKNGGFNPNVGFGVGPVGAGVGAGLDRNGFGQGFSAGVGPLGFSADGGLSRNGLGLGTSAGIGNTGASFEGGLSDGGVGLGASTRLLGFGPGVSLGFGDRGPGLGASMAFGPLGTLLIGSHRNSYPGAKRTESHTYPGQNTSYYTAQNFGKSPYYRAAPRSYRQAQYPQYRPQYSSQQCPVNWTC